MQPLIIPPQSVPPSDNAIGGNPISGSVTPGSAPLFALPWWLFFNNLAKRLLALENRPVISVDLTADYNSTSSFQDIGLFCDLTQTGLYEITANIDWVVNQDANQLLMQLVVNDIEQPGQPTLLIDVPASALNAIRVTTSYTWFYQNRGNNIARLQNAKIVNAGIGQVHKDTTGLRVKFLG